MELGGVVDKAGGPKAPSVEELVAKVPPPFRGYMPCPPKHRPGGLRPGPDDVVTKAVVPRKTAPRKRAIEDSLVTPSIKSATR